MARRLLFFFDKNIKKFQWEMADEINGGWFATDMGLSKEEILRVIKELYCRRRNVNIGLRFLKAYQATTPKWKEDFEKMGIKIEDRRR